MVSKPLSLENKTPAILTGIKGCRQPHLCAVCSDPPGVADDSTVHLVPAHQPGRLWSTYFLVKNQHLDFVSYSNCMQYLDGVRGECSCTKMSG